jgi:hypothetical protein
MVQSFIKIAEVLIAIRDDITGAVRDAIIQRHHPPIPAPSRVESHQAKQLHLNNNLSKAEYTNTQQDLPDKSYL